MRGSAWSLQRRVRERALWTAWRVRGDMSPEAPSVVGRTTSRRRLPSDSLASDAGIWAAIAEGPGALKPLHTIPAIHFVSGLTPPEAPQLLGIGGC